MPPTRVQPHDPFTTTASSAAPGLRNQTSQTSLRSNTSAASSRTRHQPNLFAPALSRRPTSRATPRVEDDVLADSESEQDLIAQRQRQQMRRARHGSPEGKHSRLKPRQQAAEEQDIVNRQPDGSYLLGGPGAGVPAMPSVYGQGEQENADGDLREMDAYHAAMARKYFSTGAHMGGSASKQAHDDFERDRSDMLMRLREEVMNKLEDEKWMYEPVDRYQSGI